MISFEIQHQIIMIIIRISEDMCDGLTSLLCRMIVTAIDMMMPWHTKTLNVLLVGIQPSPQLLDSLTKDQHTRILIIYLLLARNSFWTSSWVTGHLRRYAPMMSLWIKPWIYKYKSSLLMHCIKIRSPAKSLWMSNIFLWVEIFLFFVCYHVVPKRHSQLDY